MDAELVVTSMSNFISKWDAELTLCVRLLVVNSVIKKIKGEDVNVDHELIESVTDALEKCKLVFNAVLTSSNSESVVSYLGRFIGKSKVFLDLFEDLKKNTNFFRNEVIHGEILECLEKATSKFIDIAR